MRIEDTALMFEGWQDEQVYQQIITRRATMIIADVTNRSFGGKGIIKKATEIWPIHGDNKESDKLMSKLQQRLKQHKENELKTGIKRGGTESKNNR